MAIERSHARLGLFLVVSLAVVVATALVIVDRLRDRPVLEYVTYTRENITGLEVSSPVRFRGVSVGRVDDIRVDPRENLIEIDFQIYIDRIRQLGVDLARAREEARMEVLPYARARIISNPVTGAAYLLMDRMPDAPPPEPLGFTPDRPYVPMVPSPLATARDRLPAVIERAESVMLVAEDTIKRLPGSLDRADRFFTSVERIFQESHLPELSADARAFFASTGTDIGRLRATVDQLMGEGGTLVKLIEDTQQVVDASDLPATTQAVRESLDRTTLAADDLRRSLPAIREALDQLRALGRLLEGQPEAVVYGPRPARKEPR